MMVETFFYDKTTGKIVEGIQLQNYYGSSIDLQINYHVEVYLRKPDGIKYVDELINSYVFSYKPTDKEIIWCILQSVNGDVQKNVYAVVVEKHSLYVGYDD